MASSREALATTSRGTTATCYSIPTCSLHTSPCMGKPETTLTLTDRNNRSFRPSVNRFNYSFWSISETGYSVCSSSDAKSAIFGGISRIRLPQQCLGDVTHVGPVAFVGCQTCRILWWALPQPSYKAVGFSETLEGAQPSPCFLSLR
jgi:hypothetical protein